MNSNSIEIQLTAILDEYSEDVREATNRAIETVSKECVRKLKSTSPRKTGEYAKSWTVRKNHNSLGVLDAVVYNKSEGWKTHLLENGHLIRNQYGEYGRTAPKVHIKPVEDWANKELVQEIEREL